MTLGLTMRKYHRWISTIGMVVIFYLSVTGLIVIASQIGNPEATRPLAEEYGFDPPSGMASDANAGAPATTPLGDTTAVQQQLRTVIAAARAAAPEAQAAAVRVQLRMQDGQPQGIVTFTDAANVARTLAFNALTGEAIAAPTEPAQGMGPGGPGEPGAGGMGPEGMAGGPGGEGMGGAPRTGIFLLDNSQQLHSGAYYGRFAEWLILATGVALLTLSITGIWMFFDMVNRRRKQGRTGWFWT